MLTLQQTNQPKESEAQKKKKFRPWRGLFRFLDKLSLKKPLTRFFIFHPPKLGYKFESQNPHEIESDPVWEFKAQNMLKLKANPHIKVQAFKLYREKKGRTYMTPLIWLINQKSKSEYITLYSHGNSSDLGTAYSSAVTFANVFQMSVVVYDYTGYGLAPQKPSEKNLYNDIESVLSFIVTFLNYPLNKIILCGFSLGAGPTVEMAVRYHSIPFMILFAPLASCLAMVEGEKISEKGSSHDIFANLDKMPKVACDIIFVHGLDDSVIPSQHSVMMFQKYSETHVAERNNVWLLEVEDADHHQLVQELADQNTELRGSFMLYFEFLLENNHTIMGEKKEVLVEATPEENLSSTRKKKNEKNGRKTVVGRDSSKPLDDVLEQVETDFDPNDKGDTDLLKQEILEQSLQEDKEDEEEEEKDRDIDRDIEKDNKEKGSMREKETHQTKTSTSENLIKEETSRLRKVFSHLVVNKPLEKSRRKQSKLELDDMYDHVKVLL